MPDELEALILRGSSVIDTRHDRLPAVVVCAKNG
jgi:hypothetical protein